MKRTVMLLLLLVVLSLSGCISNPTSPNSAVLYQETFSGETASDWPEEETENQNTWIVGGEYHIRFKTTEVWWTATSNIEQGPFDDFQLDADITHNSGVNTISTGGLAFRVVDSDNYYVFRVSPMGSYSFLKRLNGDWLTLVDWAYSSAILEGEATNHVTIYASGSSLTFFINGEEVEDGSDSSFSTGFVGVYAKTFAGNSDMHVSFDNIVVTELE